jgi:hypothetical protein
MKDNVLVNSSIIVTKPIDLSIGRTETIEVAILPSIIVKHIARNIEYGRAIYSQYI